jgi:tetratricopeptide (TPR) repeat protein
LKRFATRAAITALASLFGVALAQSPLERAVTLAREKHYDEAQQILQGVPEPTVTSQNIAFHRLKAAIAAGLGNTAAAAAEMEHALLLAPGEESLLLGTAVAELQDGQLDAALQHASQAGEKAVAQAIVGDIQEKRGAFPEAVRAYQAAVRLDPTREEYHATLAFDLIRHQSLRPAIEALHAAIPLFPQSTRLLTLLGIAQYASGDIEDATATLSGAIKLDPGAEPAWRSLSQIVLESSAAPPGAVITQLCSWNKTVCSALKLRAARESHDAAAQAEAIAGLESAPAGDAVARCELARAWEWSNRMPDARAEMEQCVASFPSPQNHYRLGLIYQRLGLPLLAQKQMELRSQILEKMSEQTANGLNALKSIQ